MGLLDTWNKVNTGWKKFAQLGKGWGTYLVGAASVFNGVAATLNLVGDKDLAWVIANFDTIQNSNGFLMVTFGLGLIFGRRAMEGVETKLANGHNGAANATPDATTPKP